LLSPLLLWKFVSVLSSLRKCSWLLATKSSICFSQLFVVISCHAVDLTLRSVAINSFAPLINVSVFSMRLKFLSIVSL
jgi:hypothetical protein